MEDFQMYMREVQQNIPVNIVLLAKKLNVKMVEETLDKEIYGTISYLGPSMQNSEYLITINSIFNNRIKRYIVAHELSHLALHPKTIHEQGIEDSNFFQSKLSRAEEEETDALASDILMPRNSITSSLLEISSKNQEVIIQSMAKTFVVPELAMAKKLGYYRSHVLGNFN